MRASWRLASQIATLGWLALSFSFLTSVLHSAGGNLCFKTWHPVEVMRVLLVHRRLKEAFSSRPVLQMVMTETLTFTSLLEVRAMAMSLKLTVRHSKKTAEEDTFASARYWRCIDLNRIPTKPPRFLFLGAPGYVFSITSPGDLTEYICQKETCYCCKECNKPLCVFSCF